MKKVVILQHRLLHYRATLFDQLRVECAGRGIELSLVHGQPTRRERTKSDGTTLAWASSVSNHVWEVGDRDLIWQPLPRHLRNADLVVIMQESRIISNYLLLFRRLVTDLRVAYWGHGANMQSAAPNGLRERWKRLMLNRVDWWFAYTQSTVDIVQVAGFPAERITRLDNAIDTRGFKRDLAAITDMDLAMCRRTLGIGEGAPVGLFCGSLYPDKRLDFLVEAADHIRVRAPGFHCVVLGDGPSMQDLRKAAATRPWLHVLGARTGTDKALYFRLAHVMLNPGAVGLHIVDAFCSGLVLITTSSARHGPEIAYLRHGANACVTGDDTDDYAEAALGVLTDRTRLGQLSAGALVDAARYTVESVVQRFSDGLAQCLEAPKKGMG